MKPGISLQIPWDALRAADLAAEPARLEFAPPAGPLDSLIATVALLLQLARYGNACPVIHVIRMSPGSYPACARVGGFDLEAEDRAVVFGAIGKQLAGTLTASGEEPAASLVLADCASYETGCQAAIDALRLGSDVLRLVITDDGNRACLFYDAASLHADTAKRIAAHWTVLQEQVARRPRDTLASLEMIPPGELNSVDQAGSSSKTTEPRDFLDLFDARVRDSASRTAVIHRDKHITYAQLSALANRLAGHMRHLGATRGSRIAVALDPGPYGAACIIAILRLRAVYVPVDPAYPPLRITTILDDCDAALTVTSAEHAQTMASVSKQVLEIEAAISTPAPSIDAPESNATDAEAAAYVFYTSGTTGSPKGVLASRGNLAHYISAAVRRYDMGPEDTMPCLARASFSISLFELLAPLACGATSLVLDRDQVLDLPRLAHTLLSVTIFHAGPSLLRGLVTHIRAAEPATYRFARLRHASAGGDLVPPELLEAMRTVFAPAEIFVIYGCSEISVMGCTWLVPSTEPVTRTFVGQPFENTEVRVLDSRQRRLPLGVAGEVHFAGRGVIAGYLSRPELTAERFHEADGLRFYNTGDIGRLSADGTLQLLGRLDFQVQIRGMRVELGEVEYALRQYAGVRDGVVAAWPAASGENQLVAYYVPRGAEIPAAQLRAWFVARLPDYMVPTVYCALEKLPLNANLKVDRKALPDPAKLAKRAREGTVELTGTERRLATIWEAALGCGTPDRDDDFFVLGGTSLAAMRVITAVAREFALEVAASEIFRESTLRSLARLIDSRSRDVGRTAPTTISRLSEVSRLLPQPLSAAQERMWFWSEMAPGIALYNVPVMIEIDGPVDVQRLQVALDRVLERHEVLRSSWHTAEGRPLQQIQSRATWPLRVEHTHRQHARRP